ncbi:hypothetical protein [Actinomadura flavalba]|uniref:hypothetical protein n=1 Tax=Actinomadura flavalba TaxID=1120938 RepID=UPI000381C232|nr:hypothetical protein [Actinomadura flavalba]
MNTATKLGGYGAGLAALFAVALGAGSLAGPVGAAPERDDHGHGGHTAPAAQAGGEALPGGLQVSQDGYTLTPETTTVPAGKKTDFRFTVTGPDGKPVTRYTALHGKELHLIVARRDLSGFQHVHPVRDAKGVWSVPLTLPDAGTYRFFTDVHPQGAGEQLTLGTDVNVPGHFTPRDLPAPVQVAEVDGYEVRLDGTLKPGQGTELTLTVSRDGRPVTDLEPYLEAYGHLVALRDRDLAYLHVHPDGAPGDGETRPGPGITFHAEAPSTGAYRLYLDFKHAGRVRTAEFTVHAGQAPPTAPTPAESGHGDHRH